MTFVTLPLPSRAIAVTRAPFAASRGFAFGVITLLALTVFLAWWQGPGLWRDWQINQNPQVIPSGNIDGDCRMNRGITTCDAHLSYSYNGESYESDASMSFIDFSSDDYAVDVVISRGKPELATISLGLEMLWNRLAVFAVLMLLIGGGAIATLLAGYKAWRNNRAAQTLGALTLVPVEITAMQQDRGALFVSYIDYLKGPKSKRLSYTRFAKRQEALLGTDESGKTVGVAVKLEHVAVPVLLDSQLERLDLTDAERRAALEAFDAEQSQRVAPQTPAEAAKKARGPRMLRAFLAFIGIIVLLIVGVLGYWLYYVTSAPTAFDSLGMELNLMMPEPVNAWGCQQLEARFGTERAPSGCTAADYQSWK